VEKAQSPAPGNFQPDLVVPAHAVTDPQDFYLHVVNLTTKVVGG
jgi:hypothetical protein